MSEIRVVEILAALSLTTDLATGFPFEKGLQVCLVADGLAERLGLDADERRTVFQAALLRSVGCTSHAVENAAEFVDDVSFQRALKALDPGDPAVFGEQLGRFGDWAGADQPRLASRFAEIAPTVGPQAAATGCEVSRALAPAFGASAAVVRALDDVYERWDGRGIPLGRSGDQLALAARVLHTAEQAVMAHATGGPAAAVAEVARRAGGHLDPAVVAAVDARLFDPLQAPDLLDAVLDREGRPWHCIPAGQDLAMLAVLGVVADLKSTYLVGHSTHLAAVVRATGAGAAAERAALLHNLGCVVVPSSLLDRSGRLGVADRERMRLHGYWTQRILERCPSLVDLGPLARGAAAHHAAFAEGGYDDWARASELPPHTATPPEGRLLEAAEAYVSWVEPRPGRAGLSAEDAAARVRSAADRGLLDRDATELVLEGAGHARRAHGRTSVLTEREVEVLELAARGLSNRLIAEQLFLSERTVGHHLAHIYDKTGHRTRAGVAVWAVEHGVLPRG